MARSSLQAATSQNGQLLSLGSAHLHPEIGLTGVDLITGRVLQARKSAWAHS